MAEINKVTDELSAQINDLAKQGLALLGWQPIHRRFHRGGEASFSSSTRKQSCRNV